MSQVISILLGSIVVICMSSCASTQGTESKVEVDKFATAEDIHVKFQLTKDVPMKGLCGPGSGKKILDITQTFRCEGYVSDVVTIPSGAAKGGNCWIGAGDLSLRQEDPKSIRVSSGTRFTSKDHRWITREKFECPPSEKPQENWQSAGQCLQNPNFPIYEGKSLGLVLSYFMELDFEDGSATFVSKAGIYCELPPRLKPYGIQKFKKDILPYLPLKKIK